MHSEKGFGVIEILVGSLVIGMLGTGTVFASDPAVPGDLLYNLDLTIENIEETFTNGTEAKLKFKIHQAEERAEEFEMVQNRGEETEIQLQAENNYLNALKTAEEMLLRNIQAFQERQPNAEDIAPMSNALERIYELQARIKTQTTAENGNNYRTEIEIEIEDEDDSDSETEDEDEDRNRSIRVYEVSEDGNRGLVRIENNGPDNEWTMEDIEEAEPIEMPEDRSDEDIEDEDETGDDGETEPGDLGSDDSSETETED